MSLIDIVWSADSDGVYVAKRHTTLLPPWADAEDNAESAVNKICADFFTAEIWDEWVGYDDDAWTINVEVHDPQSIAGQYEVELHRVIEAHSRKLKAKAKAGASP